MLQTTCIRGKKQTKIKTHSEDQSGVFTKNDNLQPKSTPTFFLPVHHKFCYTLILIQINYISCQTIKVTMHALTLHKQIACMDHNYPINYSNFNEQGDISIKAMGNILVNGVLLFKHKQNAWWGAVREGNYITQWSADWRTDTQSLWLNHRSPQCTPGAKDLRPTCHPRSQCPAVAQTTGVSHRRGVGWAWGRRETPSHHGCHADCFIFTYHSTSPRLW